jgi:hypothetical protein
VLEDKDFTGEYSFKTLHAAYMNTFGEGPGPAGSPFRNDFSHISSVLGFTLGKVFLASLLKQTGQNLRLNRLKG